MPTPTLIYLHGFRSSPDSIKAQIFVRMVGALPGAIARGSSCPRFARPADAIAGVAAWIEREVRAPADELTLVGSSLGGYYATYLAERFGARAVLINPAIRPFDDLLPYAGTQTNLYSGQAFEVTEAHFAELRAMRVPRHHAAASAISCWCAPATRCSTGARRSRSTAARGSTSPAAAITAGRTSRTRCPRSCDSPESAATD